MTKAVKPLKPKTKVWIIASSDGLSDVKEATIVKQDDFHKQLWFVKHKVKFEDRDDWSIISRNEVEIYRTKTTAIMSCAARLIKSSNDRLNKAVDMLFRLIGEA